MYPTIWNKAYGFWVNNIQDKMEAEFRMSVLDILSILIWIMWIMHTSL